MSAQPLKEGDPLTSVHDRAPPQKPSAIEGTATHFMPALRAPSTPAGESSTTTHFRGSDTPQSCMALRKASGAGLPTDTSSPVTTARNTPFFPGFVSRPSRGWPAHLSFTEAAGALVASACVTPQLARYRSARSAPGIQATPRDQWPAISADASAFTSSTEAPPRPPQDSMRAFVASKGRRPRPACATCWVYSKPRRSTRPCTTRRTTLSESRRVPSRSQMTSSGGPVSTFSIADFSSSSVQAACFFSHSSCSARDMS
mmetsp:Transcript_66557/g.150280  ORF Transcript_66557/g.150280 Transcript_66557/m.150280 type:complete len:258 (-) Transcript_66557:46-819(-)